MVQTLLLQTFLKEELTNPNNIWYHTTLSKNLESIKNQGLLPNQEPNYSMASLEYMNDVYGMIPIFLSKYKEKYDNDENAVLLEVDMSGLERFLVADIPTLASHFGAYLEQDGIWFEEGSAPIPEFDQEEEITFEELLSNGGWAKDLAIELTRTCACLKPISSDRIKLVSI